MQTIPLLTLQVRSKRDVLVARQRARQIAGLLGYGPREQIAIASAAFEIAWSASRQRGGAMHFQIEEEVFQILPGEGSPPPVKERNKPGAFRHTKVTDLDPRGVRRLLGRLRRPSWADADTLRIEKPLPEKSRYLTQEDLTWVIQELSKHTPLNLFEEVHQQNQELLRLLHDLQERLEEQTTPEAA